MAKVGQALHRLIGKRRAIKATLKGKTLKCSGRKTRHLINKMCSLGEMNVIGRSRNMILKENIQL